MDPDDDAIRVFDRIRTEAWVIPHSQGNRILDAEWRLGNCTGRVVVNVTRQPAKSSGRRQWVVSGILHLCRVCFVRPEGPTRRLDETSRRGSKLGIELEASRHNTAKQVGSVDAGLHPGGLPPRRGVDNIAYTPRKPRAATLPFRPVGPALSETRCRPSGPHHRPTGPVCKTGRVQ